MKRSLAVVIALAIAVAVGVAAWPRARQAEPAATGTATAAATLSVPPRVLEGAVDAPDLGERSRVAALIGGTPLADAPVRDGRYRLELPARPPAVALEPVENVPLVQGYGRLQGEGARAAAVRLVLYDDENGSGQLEPGETEQALQLIRAGQDTPLRGFFRYGLMLLSGPAELKEVQDSPTGAQDYYRYDLELPAGWTVIESELVSNGYSARAATGSGFDAYPAEETPAGAQPPTLNP